MLFGVPDEITDVTRVSGMVRKRRLIYRMTSFGYRKSFGLIGSVPGVPGGVPGTIGRGVTPQGVSWAMGRDKPAPSGLE